MEKQEKKIGTATIDINEYDRLMKLERDLDLLNSNHDKYKSEICHFFIDLSRAFDESNKYSNDSIMLDKMVANAGYLIKIKLPSGNISIGNGKKVIDFNYAKV